MKANTRYGFLLVFLVGVVVAALVPVATPCYASSGISLQGVSDELPLRAEVSPGETRTFTMTVSLGDEETAVDVVAEVKGFGQTLDGELLELDDGDDDSLYSALDFTTVSPHEFYLEPGASQTLTVTVDVPESVESGGLYAVVSVKVKPPGEGNVQIVASLDVPILLSVAGSELEKKADITEFVLPEIVSGSPAEVSATVKNTGNYHYQAEARFTVRDASGTKLGSVSTGLTSTSISIIPTYSRQFEAFLSSEVELQPGSYYVEMEVLDEKDEVLDKETRTFEIDAPIIMAGQTPTPTPSGIVDESLVTVDFDNEEPAPCVDASTKADVKVCFEGTGTVSGQVVAALYEGEPSFVTIAFSAAEADGGTGKEAVKFVSVCADGFSQGTAIVTVYYSDDDIGAIDDEGSLFLAYWDGDAWTECTTDADSEANWVSGEIAVEDLCGAATALGGEAAPAANSGGWWALLCDGLQWWHYVLIAAGALMVIGLVVVVLVRHRSVRQDEEWWGQTQHPA